MEYFRITLISLSFLVSDITAAMQVESVKKSDIEVEASHSAAFYIRKSMDKLVDHLKTLKIPEHLQPAFIDISEGIISSQIAEFIKDLDEGKSRDAFKKLSVIKSGLSQFTIAYALGGHTKEEEELDFEPYNVPDNIPYTSEFTEDNFDKALTLFVEKVINEVFRQYEEARTSTINVFSTKPMIEPFKDEEEEIKTTQLINIKYFLPKSGYFNPKLAKLIPLSTGGAFTEGLWMLKIKGESGKWSNRLIIKEVKASNAFAELKALSIVTSDPVISAVSMGVNNLKQLEKLDKAGSGVSARAKKLKYLQSNPSWIPGFLPKLTFDVTQYKVEDKDGKPHYLTVLGLAKGKPISDYFKSAVTAAGPLSSDEFANTPSVKLFYKAMQASGIAFAQFHQVTNSCMLFR
jgi:hypothetical protein